MDTLSQTGTVIDALGGTAAVARITGRSPQAVSNWRARSTFPSDTFLVLSSALTMAGQHAPTTLWGMSHPSPAPKSERAA